MEEVPSTAPVPPAADDAGSNTELQYADTDYVVLGEAIDGGEVALSHMKVGGLTKGQSVAINADTFPGAHVFRCSKLKLRENATIFKLDTVPHLSRIIVITR